MKKLLLSFGAIVMVAVTSVCFLSCSSDSDENNFDGILKSYAWKADANYDLMSWGDELSLSKENVKLYFLGNGSGIGKSYTKEVDTYFGESSTTVPFAFSYSVSGSSVRINNNTYSYNNGSLVTQEGKIAFTQTSYTQSDRDWLGTARFYTMSDSERLNVNLIHGCNVDAQISDTKYSITLFLKIPASAQAHSRYITSIEAQYSIKDGTFTSSKAPENVLVISEDKDYTASTVAFVNTTSQATITASFYYFDSKNKKKVSAGSVTYLVPTVNNNNGDDNGSDGNDDQGDDLTGNIQGHDYVDLGLPSGTLWATCNVGAEGPEDYGDYYAWGETTGYKSGKTKFNWSTYKYCRGSNTSITKYCTDSAYGTIDGYLELLPLDDAATMNWGSEWRLPSKDQQEELRKKCTWTWTTKNGINGYFIKSKNNQNSIFLPAAGYYSETSIKEENSHGSYWSSSLSSGFGGAYGLRFDSNSINTGSSGRCYGRTIRPVCKK